MLQPVAVYVREADVLRDAFEWGAGVEIAVGHCVLNSASAFITSRVSSSKGRVISWQRAQIGTTGPSSDPPNITGQTCCACNPIWSSLQSASLLPQNEQCPPHFSQTSFVSCFMRRTWSFVPSC